MNAQLVQQLVERWPGVKVTVSSTGQQGLSLADAEHPDLILLGMHLPDMTGLQVLETLKQSVRTHKVPVVALSASAMPHEVAAANRAGAVDYWAKPINFEVFYTGVPPYLDQAPSA